MVVSSLEQKDDSGSLWKQIVSDSLNKDKKRLRENSNVLVLGDWGCGKTELIRKMNTHKDIQMKKGAGLEYTYLQFYGDNNAYVQGCVNVWILDGNRESAESNKNLMKYAVNEKTIVEDRLVLVIVIDLSTPWNAISSVELWIKYVRDYIETNVSLSSHNLKLAQSTNEKRWICSPSQTSSSSGDSAVPQEPGSSLDDFPEILQTNCGIPIVVVGTKSDLVDIMEVSDAFTLDQQDFFQFTLRKTCMKYGAGLVYTSLIDRNNIDLLFKYLLHLLYPHQIPQNGKVDAIDRYSLFIPIGWDSMKKALLLADLCKSIDITTEKLESHLFSPANATFNESTCLIEPLGNEDFYHKVQLKIDEEIVQDKDCSRQESFQKLSLLQESIGDGDSRLSNSGAKFSGTSTSTPQSKDSSFLNFFNSLLNST